MGHVQDRWYRPEVDPATKKVRKVKTSIHGKGQRYKVRYIDPDGVERSRTFPDRCKKEADDFLVEVESAKREGKYVSVNAGKISFKAHAENWLKGQSTDRATRGALRSRLDARIYPFFEKRPLNSITPAIVRNWLGELDDRGYSANYRTVLFTIVSSVLDSAVEERLITHNPCKAQRHRRSSARPRRRAPSSSGPAHGSTRSSSTSATDSGSPSSSERVAVCARARSWDSVPRTWIAAPWSSTSAVRSGWSNDRSCSRFPKVERRASSRCPARSSTTSPRTSKTSRHQRSRCRGTTPTGSRSPPTC